jgi:molecular chaperone GrpE
MSNPADRAEGDPENTENRETDQAGAGGDIDDGDGGIVVEVEEPVAAGSTDRVAELEAALGEAEARANENYDRLVRTAADLDNLRKRSRREVADTRVDAQSRALREILPVMDNLERAVAAAATATDATSIREGIELVIRQFHQTFEKLGVRQVEAVGAPFDPNFHEAVSQVESAAHAPGTVVEVLQTGYTIGDRLLRAALAVVAAGPPRAEEPEQPAADADPAEAASEEPGEPEIVLSEEGEE